MENASKALIIAGAILISILLISLGIMVFTNARENIDSADLSAEKVQAHNAKFESYLGNISGTTANALQSLCAANNVTLTVTATTGVTGTSYYSFEKTGKYVATATKGTDGKITTITIANPTN